MMEAGRAVAETDWLRDIGAANAVVEAWTQAMMPVEWLERRTGAWTGKDLLGHLAAWSDLLIDQVEALGQERPDTIEAVNVDAWNAIDVARRRSWTVEETIAAWRRAAQRVEVVISGLPPEAWDRRWQVPWATEPVAIADLLRLWLVHVEQHRLAVSLIPPEDDGHGAAGRQV
jgi:hypothetical protein